MKKLSIIAAGAALSAVALAGPATASTTAASAHGDAATQHVATSRTSAPSKARIAALFDRWNTAVLTGDAEKVADLYAPDAVLLPTLSPEIRTTHDGIVDYFEEFLAKHPSGEEIRSVVKVLDARTAIDTGIYRFTFHNVDGTTTAVDARYTFVYEKRHGTWWIINHHSSLMPVAS
jgi:uncharacterized protein (TIGR02246 family)